MASSGKKGKTKWKAVPLGEVCGTGLPRKTTNWVDQVDSDLNGDMFDYSHKMEKVVLPTAPRAARAPENEAKVPKEPPFQAYISNLPYEILEDELVDFFHDMKIKSVRLPRDDRGNRARGFGYVEFEDRQSLLSALGLGDTLLKGRRMRIEVAEHSDMNRGMGKGSRDGNRGGDPDRTMGDWRSGPRNEDREDKDSYRGGSRRDYGGSGFSRRDGDRGGFRDRDGFSDRGGGFSDRGGSGFRDRGRDREYNRDDYGGGGFRDSGDRGYRDSDRSYYSDRRDRDGDRGGGGGGGGVGTWRRETDRDKDRDRDRGDSLPPPEKNEPKTRTKLNLQPRTKPIEDIVVKEDSADEAPVSGATASSIFGGARPVDTAAREREIEERLAREREEKLEEAARSKTGPPPSKDRDKERDRDRDRDRDKERDRDRDQGPPPPREDSQPPPSSRNLEAAPPPKENPWGRRPQPPPQVNNGRVSPREDSDSSSKHRDTTPPPSHRQSGKEDTREPDSQKKYQPPRRHQQESEQKKNRDDDRRRDDKWKSGGGGGPGVQRGGSSAGTGGTGAGLAKSSTEGRQITPRARELRKDSGDDVSRMPKLQEHVAPNFAASNKFAFLDDTDTAPEED